MYKELLKEFQLAIYRKTGDWRSDINQTFVPNGEASKRMISLISEESLELIEALQYGTLSDVRKEVCDLLYVTYGPAAILDIPVESDFYTVHKNNMLKINTGVLRAEDGKFMKHPDHPKVVFT